MKSTLSAMQHRKILFLISLPDTQDFKDHKEDIEECLKDLREREVDVREHIWHKDLADANNYDIVIVVADHDTNSDTLVLADGIMSITEFIDGLPSDFKGIIDFSSCYSITAFQAIKQHCPSCRVQVALKEVRLLRRLIMYPSVVELLREDDSIDYSSAYNQVSKEFDEIVDEVVGEQTEKPEMTHLGAKTSSIYAPPEVKRASRFMIQIILHYDSESSSILAIAKGHEPDTIWRGKLLGNLCEGDIFSIRIRFDSDNICVVDDENAKHNEYVKQITVCDEVVEEQFMVEVASEFSGSSFWTVIDLLKDNSWVSIFRFKIIVSDNENKIPADIVMEMPEQVEKPEDIIKCYVDVFTGRIFDYESHAGNYSSFQQILCKKNSDSDKLHFIRRFIYNNEFFLEKLKSFLDDRNKDLSDLLRKDFENKTIITYDIIPVLRGCITKLQERLESFQGKFEKIHVRAQGGNVLFDEVLPKIPSLESKFIDLSSEIKHIDFQILMLRIYKDLKDNLNKYSKEDIKESASDFWEYPHKYSVDKELFDILRSRIDVGAIKHPKSGGDRGVTMPYLALLLAMVCGEYISVDNGKEDWYINIDEYIDLGKYNKSLRTPKNRINKFISLLRNQDVRDKISRYMKTKVGKMSISAELLLKIKV